MYITFKNFANKDQYFYWTVLRSALETLVATFLSTRFKEKTIYPYFIIYNIYTDNKLILKFAKVIR